MGSAAPVTGSRAGLAKADASSGIGKYIIDVLGFAIGIVAATATTTTHTIVLLARFRFQFTKPTLPIFRSLFFFIILLGIVLLGVVLSSLSEVGKELVHVSSIQA